MEKYIKEISPLYVYTRQISIKEPFTEKVRKAMTENVKKSVHASFLNQHVQVGGKNGKFANGDRKVFNFARSEVFKNASTQKPARLNETFASYIKSIGQIACGKVRGTCFLVADALVITNYHIYRMIKDERNRLRDPNLPITVLFGYLRPEQTEHIFTVEVDEERDTTFENPFLDYKFFHLRQSEGLNYRVPLGPMVRNWQLSDGQVIILGHPKGKEMKEEVCVVVGYRKMQERIRERHEQFNGVHMTNAQLLQKTEDYQGRLSYDTSFFRGASGSPVIEMNGNIVAMHTQGYLLDRTEENIPNQQEPIPHQEQQDIPRQRNTRTYSLMEFGVQFISICRDIRRQHGENVAETLFPHYKLKPGEAPMDAI
ncbi:FAM111A [Paramuricea clavata]|uniref:Serine protease n=1 Tax=Paramuricea clavata TaxID=317549 RepID=A0A7D9JK15_PARCT|nr:FAM111A [Paramuricea clavata]